MDGPLDKLQDKHSESIIIISMMQNIILLLSFCTYDASNAYVPHNEDFRRKLNLCRKQHDLGDLRTQFSLLQGKMTLPRIYPTERDRTCYIFDDGIFDYTHPPIQINNLCVYERELIVWKGNTRRDDMVLVDVSRSHSTWAPIRSWTNVHERRTLHKKKSEYFDLLRAFNLWKHNDYFGELEDEVFTCSRCEQCYLMNRMANGPPGLETCKDCVLPQMFCADCGDRFHCEDLKSSCCAECSKAYELHSEVCD